MSVREFSGTYVHSFDPKSRVSVPVAYREDLGEDFTLGMNSEGTALALIPKDEWERMSERLNRVPTSDQRGRAYVRYIKAFSFPHQSLDKQGRVMIPAVLREKAKLGQTIYFVGSGPILEIYDEAAFNDFCAAAEANLEELNAYMNEKYFNDGI